MRVCLVAALVAVAMFGCSSVPDVVFVDDEDAATLHASDAGDEEKGSGDGGPGQEGGAKQDGGHDEDSGQPPRPTQYRCPDEPPPSGEGVCCGDQLCLRCSDYHCGRCEREACAGDEVCCASRGSGGGGGRSSVDCRAPDACRGRP